MAPRSCSTVSAATVPARARHRTATASSSRKPCIRWTTIFMSGYSARLLTVYGMVGVVDEPRMWS